MPPVVWLCQTWLFLLVGGPFAFPSLVSVGIACSARPRQLWRYRLLLFSTISMLAAALGVAALLLDSADIVVAPYIHTLAIVIAPVAVVGLVDGFWVCGLMTRLRFPSGIVLAVAAALGSSGYVLSDVRSLLYHRQRLGRRGIVPTLAASIAILLDRIVAMEVAYEMFDVSAVYSRWTGRSMERLEWLHVILTVVVLAVGVLTVLATGP